MPSSSPCGCPPDDPDALTKTGGHEGADEGKDAVATDDAAKRAPHGLSSAEAAERLRRDGPNLLPQPERRRWLALIGNVLREPMLLLLLGASGVYLLLGDPQEAALLGVSVLLVVALTVYQEYKSERALQALRDLSSPRAHVLRDGGLRLVAASELVRDDVISLDEGDRVPADACVLADSDLHVDESMLTGESVPVRRSAAFPDPADRLVSAGTLVVRGRGLAKVVETGSATAMGRIGVALHGIRPEPTRIQREMRRVVWVFAALSLGTSALVVSLYLVSRGGWLEALLAGITLAIANIPEEFPVVLTVFLALGAWRMARQRALVRRAPAIEALGAVTALCADKTGTLTENRMAVAELRSGEESGEPAAELSATLRELLDCADLASQELPHDPMEQAIRAAAQRLQPPPQREGCACVHDYPFSEQLLAVTRVWRRPGAAGLRIACKGAPEAVLELCALPLPQRQALLDTVESMAGRGLRVIAAAQADWPGDTDSLPLSPRGFRFRWLGLLGLADPLRAGVADAVAQAQAAGVRVLMLTGDHLQTARSIAAAAGLSRPDQTLLGQELDTLEAASLAERVRSVAIYARVRPEQKLRLVRALKQNGEVVAMTGDGVNDAPALMAAHVGIAMGGRGTDVAREAASIVLLDDNFVTVVQAIRLGRSIYDNIRRAVRYILAVHVPITGLALLPLLLGDPLVLLPLHVVFMELIIDPACSIVFEREAPAAGIMQRPPRKPSQRLLDIPTLLAGVIQGLAAFAAVLAVYLIGRRLALPGGQLASLAFIAIVVGNLGLIALNRPGGSLWRSLAQPNPAFWVVALAASVLLMVITGLDTPAGWFRFSPAPARLVALAVLLPLAVVVLLDLLHRLYRLYWRDQS